MKYVIRISPRFDEKPDPIWFESFCDKIIDIINTTSIQGNASFTVRYPSEEDISNKRYNHTITIVVESYVVFTSKSIFNEVSKLHPLSVVQVQDYRFANMEGKDIYWTNDGELSYHDSDVVYRDPNYDFHINDHTDYTIVDVATYLDRRQGYLTEREYNKYRKMSYMWMSTGSWDNPLNSSTLMDAINEFEEYYYDMLWKGVEGCQASLNNATKDFRNFADYMRRK